VQVKEAAELTLGGIMLPEAAREKPIAGTVVRVGPGKREKDGSRKPPTVGCFKPDLNTFCAEKAN
jgi:chaperonin GroES